MKFDIEPATDGKHKYVGIFTDEKGEEKRVSFGDKSYEDFTQHRNRIRRSHYLARHRSREHWDFPMTAGSLSKWILWGDTPYINMNVKLFKKRFNLE